MRQMYNLTVQIIRYVDNLQPGVVACELLDAAGCCHTFIDKLPIFTTESLDATSAYPGPGIVRCEVVARWKDAHGHEFVRVSTATPDSVKSTEGVSAFTVLAKLIHPASG
jgi:hypothetical protein